MNTERSHPHVHPGTVDRSNPRAPKRTFARTMVSNSRRLRARVGVAIGVCLGLAALVITME